MTLSEGRNPQGVSIRAATKSYGMFNALDAVSLSVRPGEAAGIIGHNGAGKTTLLKVLFGQIRPMLLARPQPVTRPIRALTNWTAVIRG